MPVEHGKIDVIENAKMSNENLEFVQDQLSRARLRLIEVQRFMIKKGTTGLEREVSDAINSVLYAQRRLSDAIMKE